MKKILLIDDDKDLLESLELVLASSGYEVCKALSAREGLEMTRSRNPDLIILDVMMETETAGFQLAYQLKSSGEAQEGRSKNIPLLMLTSIGKVKEMRFDPAEDKEYLPVEMFMEKPVRPDVLLETVKELLK